MTAKLMPLDSIVRDRFAPVHWSQIHIAQKRDSLIESLLDAGGFSVAYGASGSRKTFFAIDLAGHVAMGWDWRGREVKQGAAVYIAVEGGGSGFNDRITAFKHHHDVDTSSGQFFVIGESPDLCHDQTDVGLLIEQITKAVTGNVALIVVDTLSRALAGGSKNASDDMGALVRHCDALRQATGAHLMLIHHTGKDDSKGARGHSLLKAAVDTEIEITATGQTSTATVTKQRDHPGGESMKFHLEVIEIGEDGREVGVVVPSDDGAMSPPRESKKQGHLTNSATIALRALRKAVDEAGAVPPACNSIPQNTRAVTEAQWRKYAYALDVSKGEERARQLAFQRSSQSLLALGFAATWEDQYWLCR